MKPHHAETANMRAMTGTIAGTEKEAPPVSRKTVLRILAMFFFSVFLRIFCGIRRIPSPTRLSGSPPLPGSIESQCGSPARSMQPLY